LDVFIGMVEEREEVKEEEEVSSSNSWSPCNLTYELKSHH
jgi:hypothetical protein